MLVIAEVGVSELALNDDERDAFVRHLDGADHHRAGQPEGPPAMEAVNIRIGPLDFDHTDYDADGDVLYLHIGQPQPGEDEETSEGHVLRFAPGTQRIVGLTVINARRVLDRDGRLIVTVPETVEATTEDLAPGSRSRLTPAA